MGKEPSALAAALSRRAPEHLVERSGHIAVFHDLTDNVSFPAHSTSLLMALQAFNPWVRLLRDIAVLPNSTRSLVFSAFQFLRPDGPGQLLLLWLIPLGSALGTRSRRCRPILFLPIVFQTRPDVRIRVRSIVIRIRVRHTAIRIRVVVAAIDHTAYWGNPPFSDCKVTKSFLSLYFFYDFTTFFRRADARILLFSL